MQRPAADLAPDAHAQWKVKRVFRLDVRLQKIDISRLARLSTRTQALTEAGSGGLTLPMSM